MVSSFLFYAFLCFSFNLWPGLRGYAPFPGCSGGGLPHAAALPAPAPAGQSYCCLLYTSTDEHGQKIQDKAAAKGVTPKEYVDAIVATVKDLWKTMDVSYDRFIRTTDDYHVKSVQKIFTKLHDQGDIYKSTYKGMYCKPCESFWTCLLYTSEFACMSYRERLALKHSDPDTYRRLREK